MLHLEQCLKARGRGGSGSVGTLAGVLAAASGDNGLRGLQGSGLYHRFRDDGVQLQAGGGATFKGSGVQWSEEGALAMTALVCGTGSTGRWTTSRPDGRSSGRRDPELQPAAGCTPPPERHIVGHGRLHQAVTSQNMGTAMASRALHRWQTEAQRSLDEIEQAHRAVGGAGPGRRYATQQINQAYVVMVSSQFQRFCRDLHSEAVDHLTADPGPNPNARYALLRLALPTVGKSTRQPQPRKSGH